MYLHAHRDLADDEQVKVEEAITGVRRYDGDDVDGEGIYISGHNFAEEADRKAYAKLVTIFGVEGLVDPDTPSAEVIFNNGILAHVRFVAAYWRKANQIHSWFVSEVQGGVDECDPYPCTREQLHELRALCSDVLSTCETTDGMVWNGTRWMKEGGEIVKEEIYEPGKVLVDSGTARQKLPTTPGFFFGSTDYDEGYVFDLENTVMQIDRSLKLPDEWSFIYRSSW